MPHGVIPHIGSRVGGGGLRLPPAPHRPPAGPGPAVRRPALRGRAVRGLVVLGLAVLAPGASMSTPARGAAQEIDRVGVVRGMVLEADSDRPVPGAVVVLVALPVERGRRGPAGEGGGDDPLPGNAVDRTDERGRYAFRDVAPGPYRIEISGLGYRSATVWIDLPRNWDLRRSVALEVEPVALDALEVRPERTVAQIPVDRDLLHGSVAPAPETTGAGASVLVDGLDVRVLDPRELPGIGTLGEPDVFRALQRLPGVSARGDFSAGVWTRASPWGMTQVLLDGLPLYDPLHMGGITAGLASDGLESVTLWPGVRPPSASDGAAGTIALTTRRAAAERSGSVAISSMAVRARVEERLFEDRVGLAVTARRSWWDVLEPPSLFTDDPSAEEIDYRFADLAGRLDLRLGPFGLLELGGVWEEDRLLGEIPDLVAPSRGRWGNRLGWARLGRRVGGVRVETMIGGVVYRVATRPLPWTSFLGPGGVPSLDHIETGIRHSVWSLALRGAPEGAPVTWGAGLRVVRERLDQFGAEAQDRELPGVHAAAEQDRARGWVEATVDLGSVDLAGGASFDRVPGEGASPPLRSSLRIRWQPRTWLTLEGARGDAVQFIYPLAPAGASLGPALGTGYVWIMAVDGRPPLVSHTSTAGASFALPGGASAQLTAWWRDAGGFRFPGVSAIDAGDVRPVSSGGTGGRERGRGIEARLDWRSERWTAGASYSLGRSTFSSADGTSWPSPAERRHSLGAHALGRMGGGWKLGADLTVESGWPLMLGPPEACGADVPNCVDPDEDDDVPTEFSFGSAPHYASLDLEVEWEHTWERVAVAVTGSLRNAFGRDNAAAYRSGTCEGAAIVSSACARARGLARFSSGLTSPTPSLALSLRF